MIEWAVIKALPWKWIGIGLVALGIVTGSYFVVTSYNTAVAGKVKAENALIAYKKEVENDGKAAAAEALWKDHENEMKKERVDAALKKARDDANVANAGWLSLARTRAAEGYLSKPSPAASDPTRATFNRAEFERAVGYLDERGQGIAKQGDDQRIGLDNAKKWAQEK